MTNKLPSTISTTDQISAHVLIARNVSRVNCPKLVTMVIFKPHYFTKNDHRCNIFSNLSSRQQYFLNDKKKLRRQKGYFKSLNLFDEKKSHLSTNILILSLQNSEQLYHFSSNKMLIVFSLFLTAFQLTS